MAASGKTHVGSTVCKKWTEEAMTSAVEAVGEVTSDEETVLSLRGDAK